MVSELGGKANAGWRVRQLGSVATEGLDPAELSIEPLLEIEGEHRVPAALWERVRARFAA